MKKHFDEFETTDLIINVVYNGVSYGNAGDDLINKSSLSPSPCPCARPDLLHPPLWFGGWQVLTCKSVTAPHSHEIKNNRQQDHTHGI